MKRKMILFFYEAAWVALIVAYAASLVAFCGFFFGRVCLYPTNLNTLIILGMVIPVLALHAALSALWMIRSEGGVARKGCLSKEELYRIEITDEEEYWSVRKALARAGIPTRDAVDSAFRLYKSPYGRYCIVANECFGCAVYKCIGERKERRFYEEISADEVVRDPFRLYGSIFWKAPVPEGVEIKGKNIAPFSQAEFDNLPEEQKGNVIHGNIIW